MKSQAHKGIAVLECTNPALKKYVFRYNFYDISDDIVEFDFIETVGHEPTRNEKIHAEIRARYEDNDELMILRRYSSDFSNPEYKAAFDEYNAFVEEVLAKYENDDV